MPEAEKDRLRDELKKIQTLEELDRHLEEAGGISLDDATFEVYLDEYLRRGWQLPQ